ncbi:MAG: hypothetical protein AAF004_08305 [Pseudomonadota bacterium]
MSDVTLASMLVPGSTAKASAVTDDQQSERPAQFERLLQPRGQGEQHSQSDAAEDSVDTLSQSSLADAQTVRTLDANLPIPVNDAAASIQAWTVFDGVSELPFIDVLMGLFATGRLSQQPAFKPSSAAVSAGSTDDGNQRLPFNTSLAFVGSNVLNQITFESRPATMTFAALPAEAAKSTRAGRSPNTPSVMLRQVLAALIPPEKTHLAILKQNVENILVLRDFFDSAAALALIEQLNDALGNVFTGATIYLNGERLKEL